MGKKVQGDEEEGEGNRSLIPSPFSYIFSAALTVSAISSMWLSVMNGFSRNSMADDVILLWSVYSAATITPSSFSCGESTTFVLPDSASDSPPFLISPSSVIGPSIAMFPFCA